MTEERPATIDVPSALANLALSLIEVQKRLSALEDLSGKINTGAGQHIKNLHERLVKLEIPCSKSECPDAAKACTEQTVSEEAAVA